MLYKRLRKKITREVRDNMANIIETLGNAKMAHTNMDININSQELVKNIFALIEEDMEGIEEANKIDVKNQNGFKLDAKMLKKIKIKTIDLQDSYRKVIYMKKNDNNYLEGKQTDNIGTICVIYDGNTYCLLELVIKAILTHNAIILTSKTDYMKATNELIVILIQRILETYKIDKNLVQILYTNQIEELLSNSTSINKVIAIGNKSFQDRIKEVSKIEVIGKGYNNFDIYIEDNTNISLVKKIAEQSQNIDIYVKKGLEKYFEEYILVEDIEEAIGLINCNTSGFSSSIFTNNNQNAAQFLREVKTETISVNSSPLINTLDIDIEEFIKVKNMLYPNPLSEGTEKSKFEFPTVKAILEDTTSSTQPK